MANTETGTAITVLGATGKSGRRVVAALRAGGHRVLAASRSGEVRFDWEDPQSWAGAVTGARAVYIVPPEDAAPLPRFLDAARAAGVRRVVLLSGRGGPEVWKGRFGNAMAAAEEIVRSSGLEWVIVRANNFMQNFTEELWHAPVLAGRLALPVGGVPEPLVDLDDVAAVVARLLVDDDHADGVRELSGPTAVSFTDAVATIAAATGRAVRFEDVDPEAYVAELRADGLGEELVAELSGLWEIMREGSIATPTDGVAQVLGRPARSFDEWVAATAPTGVWQT
jgi:uncharacterized protein YbjT (DUF2867 family)